MGKTYEDLKKWRQQEIQSAAAGHFQLNAFHDELMKETFQIAQAKVESEQGKPPAPFAFFLMGSAGRFEQQVLSDQDHGIVFDGDESSREYFLKLGTEISEGLAIVGYELCEGKVMASNPLWCQSITSYKNQITAWLDEASWQTLRNFSILFDSRVLVGEEEFLSRLKWEGFSKLENDPRLYSRLIDNFEFIKKGVGFFGQLLPEQRNGMKGDIHIKETVYFPYVNSLRILAFKQGIRTASTLERFKALSDAYPFLRGYQDDFLKLLEFRLKLKKEASTYEKVHLLEIDRLSKQEKQKLKRLIKRGNQLFSKTKSVLKEEIPS
ncbi:DUF294 nucleotidyltransferase-like domain-containing protein [Halobacillus sp. Marseille-Q1614]|uniref:DUF294 nucleotidyltransferase-like domain-containing protein n=1 Tax=Halobacillus sp. Marseille-Q1614 TaxID=2709134 RepID=UPI0015703348|nr:DUF294 nucleotidyltransferase-like domain-containing protein [Halobacillus sp. Marseille-Q1614]